MRRLKITHDGKTTGGFPFGIPKISDAETGEEIDLGPIQSVTVKFAIGDFALAIIVTAVQVDVPAAPDDSTQALMAGGLPLPVAIGASPSARVLYPCGCVAGPYLSHSSHSPLPDYCPTHGGTERSG